MKSINTILLLLLALTASAATDSGIKQYEVRNIAGGKVIVDNREIKIGDKFTSKSIIKWTSMDQGIKASDGTNMVIFVPNAKQKNKSQQAARPYKMTGEMSVRGYPTTTEDHIEAFQQAQSMEDGLAIPTGWRCDGNAGFTATFTTPDGRTVTKPVDHVEGLLLFDRDFFEHPNEMAEEIEMEITVEYTNVTGRTITLPIWNLKI